MSERRILVTYTGGVQGVGFRATVRRVASAYKIRGWVKNSPQGSVEMVAAGEDKELEAFLRAVRDSPVGAFIDREVQEAGGVLEAEQSFEIKY